MSGQQRDFSPPYESVTKIKRKNRSRKRLGFFPSVRRLLKPSYLGGSLLLILLGQLLNLLLLGMQLPPVFAQVQEVAPSVQSLPNPSQLLQQGRTLFEAEQFADAAKVWQQAAQVYQSQGDKLNQAQAFSFMSLAYQQLGQWEQASMAITSSLQLLKDSELRTLDSKLILARTLNTQGHLQLALGQAQQSLITWQQATANYIQAGNDAGIVGSLINQVQALQNLGFYRRANKTLTELEQTLQNQPDSLLKATGLRSLGNALRAVGDLDKSRQVLQESLTLAQKLKSPQEIATAWVSLGTTAQAQQDIPSALKFYQQAEAASTSLTTRIQAQLNQLSLLLETKSWSTAIALWPQIQPEIANLPPSRTAIYARINFAQSLIRLKQTSTISTPSWPEIGQLLATAVQQAKSIKDTRAEAYALGHLGGLYEQTQQLSNAQDLTRQALNLAQTINASDIAYHWQWQLGRLLKAQGNIKEAIANYTEAINTLQSLRSDLVGINPDIQFSFRESVEPVYRQFVDLLLQSPSGEVPSQQNLIQARAVIESLQLAELENFFQIACLAGEPVQIDQVIDKDDPTAAVIYPIILADRLDVILKLPNLPLRHYKTTVAQSEVEKILEELRRKLTKAYTLRETQSLSKQVYDWLLQPAEADLASSNVKTLVFVLDGSLRNVPMAALYDGQQYLVQKYGVALTPGLQLLAPKSLKQLQLKALTGGLSEARQGFSALSNVALELAQIKSEVPSTVLLNQQFTSTTLQNEINSVSFPVVHLATHGVFSSKASETFILTWDGRINVNDLDKLLQLREQSQPNAIELLVLSACQTAAGDKRAALGLAGVAVRAGARSTLASLWSLDDESSALLMSQFYRELARSTVTKAEALRLAQLALLQNPRYQHPRYWAPYVLLGNWL
jgi:CHAT domain-containing protein